MRPPPLFQNHRGFSSFFRQIDLQELYITLGSGLVPQRPFYFCSGEYYVRLVDELRPLTYGLVGKMTKLLPKDVWATILGHSPDVADALIQSMILS